MIKKIKAFLFRQHMIPVVGATKMMLSYVMFYVAILNFLLISITAYHTTISPWAIVHAPWLNLWSFIGIILFVLLIATVIEYKLVLPSMLAFGNIQGYTHGNPVAKDLQEIKAKVDKLLEEKNKESND